MNSRKNKSGTTDITVEFVGHLDGRIWAESFAAAASSMFPGFRVIVRGVRPDPNYKAQAGGNPAVRGDRI